MTHLSKSKKGNEQIYEDSDSQQQGQVLSPFQQGEVGSNNQASRSNEQREQVEQNLYDSSQDDQQRLQKQKIKRQQLQRQRQQEQIRFATFTQEDLLKKAFEDIERTNKRVALMRKKNAKRMDDIQKVRMTQQPYLIATNTHYRGSVGQYPLLTTDKSGKVLLHPNYSLRVNDIRLSDFIQKNIKEESSANYLNEVVKFQNYAYQQRKKRRQHIE